MLREVEALAELESKHVVRLYQVIETDTTMFLALEYGEGGDLQTHVQNMGAMSEARARMVFKQIASAVAFCHDSGYAHRDLKVRAERARAYAYACACVLFVRA